MQSLHRSEKTTYSKLAGKLPWLLFISGLHISEANSTLYVTFSWRYLWYTSHADQQTCWFLGSFMKMQFKLFRLPLRVWETTQCRHMSLDACQSPQSRSIQQAVIGVHVHVLVKLRLFCEVFCFLPNKLGFCSCVCFDTTQDFSVVSYTLASQRSMREESKDWNYMATQR